MEPTLDEAISDLFGTQQPQNTGEAAPTSVSTQPQEPQLKEARTQLQAAQKAMQQGDWEKFGKAMQSLSHLLDKQQKKRAAGHPGSIAAFFRRDEGADDEICFAGFAGEGDFASELADDDAVAMSRPRPVPTPARLMVKKGSIKFTPDAERPWGSTRVARLAGSQVGSRDTIQSRSGVKTNVTRSQLCATAAVKHLSGRGRSAWTAAYRATRASRPD